MAFYLRKEFVDYDVKAKYIAVGSSSASTQSRYRGEGRKTVCTPVQQALRGYVPTSIFHRTLRQRATFSA